MWPTIRNFTHEDRATWTERRISLEVWGAMYQLWVTWQSCLVSTRGWKRRCWVSWDWLSSFPGSSEHKCQKHETCHDEKHHNWWNRGSNWTRKRPDIQRDWDKSTIVKYGPCKMAACIACVKYQGVSQYKQHTWPTSYSKMLFLTAPIIGLKALCRWQNTTKLVNVSTAFRSLSTQFADIGHRFKATSECQRQKRGVLAEPTSVPGLLRISKHGGLTSERLAPSSWWVVEG